MTSADDAALITQSLEVAGERGGDLTAAVYARLFAQQPDVEPQFVLDTDGAARGEMLSRVFEAILDFIGERRYAHRLIESEAINHEGLNVPRAVFAIFFPTVRDTVREACGLGWSEETEQAWARLLGDLDRFVGG